jgi:hypothetical protein
VPLVKPIKALTVTQSGKGAFLTPVPDPRPWKQNQTVRLTKKALPASNLLESLVGQVGGGLRLRNSFLSRGLALQ